MLNSPKLLDVGRKEMKMHLEFRRASRAAKDASKQLRRVVFRMDMVLKVFV